jgi:uncharacterized protein (DUF58 family)
MQTDRTRDIVLDLMDKVSSGALSISWRSSAKGSSGSQRRGTRKGPGLEHHGFKVYDPADGDNTSHIDPILSASETDDETYIVRLFRRPPLTHLTVLLDVNPTMNMGTGGTFKSLLGALCAALGIKAAEKFKDLVCFATYADEPVTIVKTGDAKGFLLRALVAAVEDRGFAVSRQGSKDANGEDSRQQRQDAGGGLYLALTGTHRTKRSVYLIISDFVNMNEDDWAALDMCGAMHDTIAVFVQDIRERELPEVPWPGVQYSLEDYRGEKISFWLAPDNASGWLLKILRTVFGATRTARQYRENFRLHEERILSRLEECGVRSVIVSTEKEDEAVHELLQTLANVR